MLNKQYGPNPVGTWIRDIAECGGFKDFAKYTPHMNRHCLIMKLYSSGTVPTAAILGQLCHSKVKSGLTYMHQNRASKKALQEAVNGGLSGTGILFPSKNVCTKSDAATEAAKVITLTILS